MTSENFLSQIIEPGQVVEIRIQNLNKYQGKSSWHRGYFDSSNIACIESELKLFPNYLGVYFTPNPINPDLRYRCYGRIDTRIGLESATDADVIKINWLLIDIDPVRISGISSSNTEKEKAVAVARKIETDLQQEWQVLPTVFASSGNGYHLMYRVDGISSPQIKTILNHLADKYDTDAIKVDRKVYNPARVWKLYGTWARKGEDSEERPHRLAEVIKLRKDQEPIKLDQVRDIIAAAEAAEKLAKLQVPESYTTGFREQFDVDQFISRHLTLNKTKPFHGGTLYSIDCPFNESHKNHGFIFFTPGKGISFKCFHNSCSDKHWDDLRELYDPKALRRTTNYTRAPLVLHKGGAAPAASLEPQSDIFYEDLDVKPRGFTALSDFPYASLPMVLQRAVDVIASECQSSREMVATMIMGAVSAAISNKVIINPLSQSCNLYIAIRMPPSARKSTTLEAVMAPFYSAQKIITGKHKSELASLRQELKQKESMDAKLYAAEITALKDTIADKQSNKSKRLLAEDVTPEALVRILLRSDNRIFLASAEGDVLSNMARSYSSKVEASILLYLKGYSGEFVHFARSSDNSDDALEPFLSIMVAGQNSKILDFITKRDFVDRGLISRFLICKPAAVEQLDYNKACDYASSAAYQSYYDLLKDLILSESTAALELSAEARQQYVRYADGLQKSYLGNDDYDAGEIAWIQKHHARMLRLAGILHTLTDTGSTVSATTIAHAICIAEYYRHQYLDKRNCPEEDPLLARFISYVRKNPDVVKTGISKSQIRRCITRRLSFDEHINFLDTIEKEGLAVARDLSPVQRKTVAYFPNSAILKR